MNKAFEKILDKLKQVPNEFRHKEYNEAISDVIHFIERFEENYKNGWIPCSERLPENEGKYLVCDDKGNVYESKYYGYSWLVISSTDEVIAWQQLPKPYKDGEKND